MSVSGAAGGETASDAAGARFGPNSDEVAAFIDAIGRLTGAQWKKVVAARRSAAAVTRDGTAQAPESVRSHLGGGEPGGSPLPEPLSAVAAELAGRLQSRTDDEVVAAWQAVLALVRRRQLSALTFAAHYMPFATVIPPAGMEAASPAVRVFGRALRWLTASQWELLARPWALDRDTSDSLLRAALKSRGREAEEVTALAALAVVPKHLSGDAGWAAVKTAVHGGRVLACRTELTPEQLTVLWAPLEEAIALGSLRDEPAPQPGHERPSPPAQKMIDGEPGPAPSGAARKRPPIPRGPLYGPNSAEVGTFVKAVPDLTAIQWLRVLDRRKLVASVTREGSDEPAPVVRSILAAIVATRDVDLDARCTILSAVERAGFALEARARLTAEQALDHYGAVAEVIPFAEVDAASFAGRVAALNPEELARLAATAPPAPPAAVAPLVNAGSQLADRLAGRSDEEVVTTWHALTALVRRHRLSPIKFAVSYAPFASAVPAIKPKSITPAVQRYLTAVGRLSAHQCVLLAEPWVLPDEASNALSRATADGSARVSEEAAALAALVIVPMRLPGNAGWAAAKTAAFGGRVIAARPKLTAHEFNVLWKPLEHAVPIESLQVASKR